TRFSRDWSSDVCSSDLNKKREPSAAPMTTCDPMFSQSPSDRIYRVLPLAENFLFARIGFQPPNQLLAQPIRMNDVVDDQLVGQPVDVDILFILLPLLHHKFGALRLGKFLDFVSVQIGRASCRERV